jgi:hypothetical protein
LRPLAIPGAHRALAHSKRCAKRPRPRLAASQARPDESTALFGEGFHVLPLVAPPWPAALKQALAADPIAAAPSEVLAPLGGAEGAALSWIETYARVRPGIGRLADVLLAGRLGGTGSAAELRVLQQPPQPFPEAEEEARRGQWVGLALPSALGPDPVTSLVAHALGDLDPEHGIAVLGIDEYTEVVPSTDTTTGVSLGFDAPAARPPQAVLLAVPPVRNVAWTLDGLAEVVGETLDLAKIRMIDLSTVAWAGRYVPAVYLTDGDMASGLDLPMKDLVKLANARAQVVMNR